MLFYLRTLQEESLPPSSRVAVVVVFILATSVVALIAPFLSRGSTRVALLSGAATGQFAWGFLGILTLGILLFVPAACSAVAAAFAGDSKERPLAYLGTALLAATVSLGLVALGFSATSG